MDIDDKLWDIANYVTGFAIAQVLATSFAIAKNDWPLLKGPLAHWLTLGGTLLFTAFYMAVIIWCGLNGGKNSSIPKPIWQRVTQGRLLAVLLFTIVLIGALVSHWSDN